MGFSQSGTKLAGKIQGLIVFQLATGQPAEQGFTIQKLHGEEVQFAQIGDRRVYLIHQADIRMADL